MTDPTAGIEAAARVAHWPATIAEDVPSLGGSNFRKGDVVIARGHYRERDGIDRWVVEYPNGTGVCVGVPQSYLSFAPSPGRALAPERGGGSLTEMIDSIRDIQREMNPPAPAPPAAPSGWRDIASAPKRRKVIGGFHNELGNWRTVVARYYPAGTLETEDDHLADDEGFAPEGWYEESETQDVILPIKLTHWQPLPAPPGAAPPPPVPAQAESGPTEEWWNKRCAWYSAECDRLNARIRELEGEVARERERQDTLAVSYLALQERADRLTTAAKAARDALEEAHEAPEFPAVDEKIRAALATLAAVLSEKPS